MVVKLSYGGMMREARHPVPEEITLVGVMSALSDPIRLGLVCTLADGRERGWGELRAPVAKSTLSHHLRVLRDAGLTHTRQEGTRCYVRLRHHDLDTRFPGLLATVLKAAANDGVGAHVGLVGSSAPSAGKAVTP
jgi:DNA-binding transcriptional ArsR family regulator